MQQQLGVVSSSQHWECRDFSRKVLVTFGKMRGLWRTHYGISEAVQHFIEGRPAHCCAHLVMLLQAIHQAAIDHGDWSTAALLVPSEDPLARAPFGAGERELQNVHAYRKAMSDLAAKFGARPAAQDGDGHGGGETEEAPAGPGGGRPRKK